MHLSEILNHLGEDRELYFNAVSPPIIQSSNFAFRDLDAFRNAITNELENTIYTRGNNPTVAILRKKLAALEKAEDALVFSSGSAAISAAVIGNIKGGDHIVCVQAPYSWTYSLLTKFLPRFGVEHTFVDGTSIDAIKAAIRPNTTVLYLESPNSLTYELQDLSACAALAKEHGIITICDNSYCSPIYQNPCAMGIDLVAHSGTKYINGHSDVVCGVLCGRQDLIQKVFNSEQMTLGAIISPHDAALVLRGLRTLPLRVQRSQESCQKIIAFLKGHPKVRKIHYPFDPDFPQYELAKEQMRGTGGLFSVEFTLDTLEEAEAFFYRLQRFLFAVSWGGHESLVLPTCAFYHIPGKADPLLPVGFFRFYIGLEEPEWLIEDLEEAMESITKSITKSITN